VAVRSAGAGGDAIEVDSDSPQGVHTETVTSPVDAKDLTASVSGLQRGSMTTELIPQDPTPLDPYDTTVGTSTTLVDVPAEARLLAAEITRTTANDLDLFVGQDTNGDGVAQAGEEVCRSATAEALEGCTLPDPEGGSYWVLVQNWLTGQGVDEVDLTLAVVPGTDQGNLTVTGPTRVQANVPFALDYAWDVASLDSGEVWFGIVDLSSSSRTSGDVGSTLFILKNTS
jgi:hypothetical protein